MINFDKKRAGSRRGEGTGPLANLLCNQSCGNMMDQRGAECAPWNPGRVFQGGYNALERCFALGNRYAAAWRLT